MFAVDFFTYRCTAASQLNTLSLHDALPIYVEAKRVLSTFPAIDTSADHIKISAGLERIAAVMDECCLIRTMRSEEHTSELQSLRHLVCRLLLEKKKIIFHA